MLRLAFILLSGSALVFGADFTGTWRGDAGPSLSVTLKLQQTGNILSGAEEIQGRLLPLRDGHVDGDRMRAAFGILPSGPGYIDLTRLRPNDVDRAFDSMTGTPGIIFDLRGSLNSGAFTRIAARLTDKPVTAALLRHRVWHGPDPRNVTVEDSRQEAYPAGKTPYRGRVAVLIDAGAFSQAEHTALFLEASANVIFVGTPTAGTDGEVTGIVLPGGIAAHFAAMSIRHADGRPLQRVGMLPDIWVEPTAAAIHKGRDEVLERAVDALLGTP